MKTEIKILSQILETNLKDPVDLRAEADIFNSLQPHGLCSPWNPPDQNAGVGSCSLLQGIFPPQGLNPGLQADSLPAESPGKPI